MGAVAGLAAAMVACSSGPASPEELDLDAYDAVVEEVAASLEDTGVLGAGSIEDGARGAQYEEGRCRLFAQDVRAAVNGSQPTTDEVAAVVEPVLSDTGFDALEESEVKGGHLMLTSTDEHDARLSIVWDASTLDVSLEVDADLEESTCTEDAAG